MYGHSQLGAGTIILSNGDELTVDFSSSVYSMDLGLLGPMPQPLQPYLNILRPFQMQVWLLILATLFGSSLAVGILTSREQQQMQTYSGRHFGTNLTRPSASFGYLVISSFWIPFGTLCSQSK